MNARAWMFCLATLPAAAQAWDLRLEVPFAKGQSLPQTLIQGTSQTVSGDLDTGKGAILSVNHRLLRIGPILKFEWGAEFSSLRSSGQLNQQAGTTVTTADTTLTQKGVGLGLNAQFWVPFIGLAGELGAIQRFQRYEYEAASTSHTQDLSRTWLRVGARWRLPLPVLKLYLAASYQEPISKERPVRLNSTANLGTYLNAQGSGQEFERLWTFGAGVQF